MQQHICYVNFFHAQVIYLLFNLFIYKLLFIYFIQ